MTSHWLSSVFMYLNAYLFVYHYYHYFCCYFLLIILLVLLLRWNRKIIVEIIMDSTVCQMQLQKFLSCKTVVVDFVTEVLCTLWIANCCHFALVNDDIYSNAMPLVPFITWRCVREKGKIKLCSDMKLKVTCSHLHYSAKLYHNKQSTNNKLSYITKWVDYM